MKPEPVSATVITFNEQANIAACLESLHWADEIVVVDSQSTDQTVAIARRFTPHVFVQPWLGHKQQKNFAIEKTKHRWIFSLDADERVSNSLHGRIRETLQNPGQDGYRFPRQNYFLGRWMRHGGWYPDAVIRLFRKDRGRFGGINPHDRVEIDSGRVGDIDAPLIHHTYTSFTQYVRKLEFYADIAAREAFAAGRGRGPVPAAARVLFKPLGKFFETYLCKLGCLDGTHGLVAALGSSYLTYMKEARLWELGKTSPGPTTDEPRQSSV